jgi:hypothetical protein
MNTSREYFTTQLYPLQDGILSIVKGSRTPFYLTGGTALSRRWYDHRYSEDLDLFVDNDPSYSAYVDVLFSLLKSAERGAAFSLDQNRLRRSASHTQLWVTRTTAETIVDLKIDLVNDTAPHVGVPEEDPILGRTDNWRNILANKLAALFRYEPKDAADIWIISRRETFDWREVLSDAASKEAGIDPVALHEILRGVPQDELAHVLWSETVDLSAICDDLQTVAEDILYGRTNSLTARAGT